MLHGPPNRHGRLAAEGMLRQQQTDVKARLIVRHKGEMNTYNRRMIADQYGGCPCNGCREREAECHATCKKYKEYREKADKIKAARDARKEAESYRKDYVVDHWAKKWRRR